MRRPRLLRHISSEDTLRTDGESASAQRTDKALAKEWATTLAFCST